MQRWTKTPIGGVLWLRRVSIALVHARGLGVRFPVTLILCLRERLNERPLASGAREPWRPERLGRPPHPIPLPLQRGEGAESARPSEGEHCIRKRRMLAGSSEPVFVPDLTKALSFALVVAEDVNGVALAQPAVQLGKELAALRFGDLRFGGAVAERTVGLERAEREGRGWRISRSIGLIS